MNSYITTLGRDLLHLIAPSLCPSCEEPILTTLEGICEACRASLLPAPYPEDIYEALLEEYEPEDLGLEAIGALFTFEQDSPVQRLIHAIKYKGCRALGKEMGQELGLTLEAFQEFLTIDVITPVPLHRAKLRQRGYNQAEQIGYGFAEARNIEFVPQGLKREQHTLSQTTLSASARRRNVSGAFSVTATAFTGATVLVCDDVFTTGATLNACALALLDAGALSVIAATIAMDEA